MRSHHAPRLLLLLAAAWGCGGDSPTGPGPQQPGPILIRGSDMSALYENFSVTRDGEPLTHAVVSINGTVIPTSATGFYNYQLPQALQPGEDLVVRVEDAGDVVEGHATIVTAPMITAPAADAAATRGDPVQVTWTTPESPDWFEASLGYVTSSGGTSVRDSLPASARQATIQTAGIPLESTGWHVNLFGYLHGSFTGPADADSDMRVRISAGTVQLQVGG